MLFFPWSHEEESFPLCALANRDDIGDDVEPLLPDICVCYLFAWDGSWHLALHPPFLLPDCFCSSHLLFKLPLCIIQTSPTQTAASVYRQVVCGICRCRSSLAVHDLIFMQESSYCTDCRLAWFWGEKRMRSNTLSKDIFVKLNIWLPVKIW